MSKIGDRIRVLRIKRGLTQAQLADQISKSMGTELKRSAIGNYERGIREPDLDTIEAIADFFDTSIADLMGREETEYLQDTSIPIHNRIGTEKRSKEFRVVSEGFSELERKNNEAFQALVQFLIKTYPGIFTERNDDDDPES